MHNQTLSKRCTKSHGEYKLYSIGPVDVERHFTNERNYIRYNESPCQKYIEE